MGGSERARIADVTISIGCCAVLVFFLAISGLFERLFLNSIPKCIGVCNGAEHAVLWPWFWLLVGGAAISVWLIVRRPFVLRALGVARVAAIAGALAAAAILFAVRGMDIDDKWLMYKVSTNLLETGRAVWNSEDSINVSTSFVWPYLSALGHAAADWDLGMKLLGVAFYAITSIVIWSALEPLPRVIAIGGVLLSAPALLWVVGGLETPLAVLWAVVSAWLFSRRATPSVPAWLLLGAGVFIRPELAAVTVTAAGLFMITRWFDARTQRARFLLAGLVAASFAPAALWAGANFLLFGDPLPTSAYIKSWAGSIMVQGGQTPAFIVGNGTVHFLSALAANVFSAFMAVAYFRLLATGIARRREILRDNAFLAASGFMAVCVFHAISGYQHMGFGFRYFVPPLAGLVVATAILFARHRAETADQARDLVASLVVLAVFVQIPLSVLEAVHFKWVSFSLTRAEHRDDFDLEGYRAHMVGWRAAGIAVRDAASRGQRLWMKDGTNLVGGAVARELYSLDGLYTPFKKSIYPELRNCSNWECARHFDFIFLQGEERQLWSKLIPRGCQFRVFADTPTLTIIANQTRRAKECSAAGEAPAK